MAVVVGEFTGHAPNRGGGGGPRGGTQNSLQGLNVLAGLGTASGSPMEELGSVARGRVGGLCLCGYLGRQSMDVVVTAIKTKY